MDLKNKEVLLTRPYKIVYRDGDRIVKVFTKEHGKANVFNEALCQARVEESGLAIPPVLEVSQIDGEWALSILHGTVCRSAAFHARKKSAPAYPAEG